MNEESPPAAPALRFVTHWNQKAPGEDEAVLDFWRREQAFPGEVKSDERLRQVVVHACDEAGKILAVSTAVPVTLPRLGQPTYYYRCFIGAQSRSTRLVFKILIRSFDVLEEYARSNGYPCIGMVLELENSRFSKKLRNAEWPSTRFVYIGKSRRGLELRVRYFRGARLKS